MNNFSITSWEEATLKEYDGKKLSAAKVTLTYQGTLQGHSEINYQMTYTDEASATYIGTEFFEGSVDGKLGSLVLHHRGTFKQGRVQSKFDVVSGSGSGELADLKGKGMFTSGEGQEVEYSFEYTR
jgi:hypothetical protein